MKHRKDNQTIYKTFDLVKYTQDRKFIEIFSPTTSYIKTIGSNSGNNKIIYILSDNSYSHIYNLHILQNDILVNRFCMSDTHALITNLDLLFDFSKHKSLSHNIILL